MLISLISPVRVRRRSTVGFAQRHHRTGATERPEENFNIAGFLWQQASAGADHQVTWLMRLRLLRQRFCSLRRCSYDYRAAGSAHADRSAPKPSGISYICLCRFLFVILS